MYIDTHTHIYLKDFDEDRKGIISECLNSGINKLLLPNIDKNSILDVLKICEVYKDICYPMVGLHPCYVKNSYENDLGFLKPFIKSIKPIAVGEIGIDLYWDKSFLKQQQKAFSKQIEWAKQYELPIVIHCREAFDQVFEVLDQHRSPKLFGVFHCFTGTLIQAKQAIDLNFKLGIGGVVTYKNGKIDKFLHELPLESIVLETDSPYLSPKPHRGKRNESSYLPLILDKIAECYQLSLEEVAAKTTENVLQVFKTENLKIKK